MSYFDEVWEHRLYKPIRDSIPRQQEHTWTTKEGEEIRIKDMTTSHIKNCINHVKKKDISKETMQYIMRVFNEELENRSTIEEQEK